MASRFPQENQVQLKPRKGHDMKWSCDIHGEPIAFYCKEHRLPVCDRCAIKDHGQKRCELDDIENVILDRGRKLDDKQDEIEKIKKQLKTLDSKFESSATSTMIHLQTVNDEVKSAHKFKSSIVKDKEETNIRLINEEADEEIRIINEKRDRRIKTCNVEIENHQLIVNENQAKFETKIKAISEVISKKMKDLKSIIQLANLTVDNIESKIKRIKQDDRTLVHEAPQVFASLKENLIVQQDVSDCLDRIQSEVQRVKFVEGEISGEHCGRIDGFIGKWELVKSVHIPSNVKEARVRCFISDDEICVVDVYDNTMYVTNITTGHTQKVVEGGNTMCPTSCASIDSNVIVCGKLRKNRTGGNLKRCITLYDRQWKVIRNISIPTNNRNSTQRVCVDVDRDGMILAAQSGQSNIYVINPADGKIVNTITMQGKVAKVTPTMQALSSGDIVVKTDLHIFTFISRLGETKAMHWDGGFMSWCCVDKLTDTLYITHWDEEDTIHPDDPVDQVSCDGIVQARRILKYEESGLKVNFSPCLVTHSGNLVGCYGDTLLVYEKRFIV